MKVGNDELKKKNRVKYLGVEIDRDLTWKACIERMRRQCMGKFTVIRRVGSSLVPRPKEEEEEKGPGFSRSRVRLIVVEFLNLRILLTYFCTLVTPESILNVTLSVDLLWHAKNSLDRTHSAADLKL